MLHRSSTAICALFLEGGREKEMRREREGERERDVNVDRRQEREREREIAPPRVHNAANGNSEESAPLPSTHRCTSRFVPRSNERELQSSFRA